MADAADARRRAEEALRRVLANAAAIVRLSWSDGATAADRANLERIKSAAADIAQDHKILRALLAAEREAEADVARLTRAHGGCDAQVRTLVSKGLAAIRKAEAAQSALAEDPARRFGLLALAAWWNEGQPGDLEGDVLQGYADRAGLWHHVDRHAAGVECEWCGNDGSGCGELTDAGERAWAEAESMPVRSVPSRIDELTVLLRESNAVCLCGCPESEHESYGEDGESCADEGHECIRVPKAVLAYVERLRSTPPPPSDAVREAAEAVSQTYYEIAAEAIGEDKVKAEFSSRFEERLAKRRDAARGGE